MIVGQRRKAMVIIKLIIGILLIVSLPVLFLRYYIEPRTLFYPTKDIDSFPDRVNLEFQDVFFTTSDNIRLNGWFIPAGDSENTVLFCHGNAGNISHRIEKLKFFHELGCSIFIFDYRGYGRSQGRPSEEGLYKDVEAAYKYLLSRGISASQIIGYGESIGGAVIVDLASREEMKAIILDSTLSSVKDMVKIAYPFVPYWVFSSRFDAQGKIKSIRIPKLIIHSLNDEIVPYQLGKKLYEAAAWPKEFLQIYGGHNSNFYESEGLLREKLRGFLCPK
jgi:fermentation-respiration switch protein FrsA (DUF1100 family)